MMRNISSPGPSSSSFCHAKVFRLSIKVGFQNYGSSTTGRVAGCTHDEEIEEILISLQHASTQNLRPVKGPGEPGLELCKGVCHRVFMLVLMLWSSASATQDP